MSEPHGGPPPGWQPPPPPDAVGPGFTQPGEPGFAPSFPVYEAAVGPERTNVEPSPFADVMHGPPRGPFDPGAGAPYGVQPEVGPEGTSYDPFTMPSAGVGYEGPGAPLPGIPVGGGVFGDPMGAPQPPMGVGPQPTVVDPGAVDGPLGYGMAGAQPVAGVPAGYQVPTVGQAATTIPRRSNTPLIIGIVAIVIAASSAIGFVFYWRAHKAATEATAPTASIPKKKKAKKTDTPAKDEKPKEEEPMTDPPAPTTPPTPTTEPTTPAPQPTQTTPPPKPSQTPPPSQSQTPPPPSTTPKPPPSQTPPPPPSTGTPPPHKGIPRPGRK